MNLARKDIESKVAKYLRKANRLRTLQAKLACLDELIEMLQGMSAHLTEKDHNHSEEEIQGATNQTNVAYYLELCSIHKLKFQIDVLLIGVKRELGRLKQHPEGMNQEIFDHILQCLHIILDIDRDHPEVPSLINTLQNVYPQYTRNPAIPRCNLNIAQYQAPRLCIELICNVQELEKCEDLRTQYKQFLVPVSKQAEPPTDASICRLRFYEQHLTEFEIFHEELQVKPSYAVTVNNHELDERSFSEWFQCYKRFLKAKNPQYCYGASPLTFNVFGCHKLNVRDVAKSIEDCWFYHGTYDQDSRIFLVATDYLCERIQAHLPACGFCPALTQEKLLVGMALLPRYINPECDAHWRYLDIGDKRIGVIPAGNDMMISIQNIHQPVHLENVTLIEVGPTPYINKALRYLHAKDRSVLNEVAYQGISTCMICHRPYKLHTMTCSKCRTDFGKYALKDIEHTLAQIHYTRKIDLRPGDFGVGDQKYEAQAGPSKRSVSFDHLWSDPQVRALLASEQPTSKEERGENAVESAQQRPRGTQQRDQAPHLPPQDAQISPRTGITAHPVGFHEKIKRLVSKRYREQKAIEHAFSQPPEKTSLPEPQEHIRPSKRSEPKYDPRLRAAPGESEQKVVIQPQATSSVPADKEKLIEAIKKLKPRQKSELSKRGVVRVIYHATMDKDTCPLCAYLDGMVMDPDDPATDIFCPPLYSGCTCSREYVLKTEKPKNWPNVTFQFPPEELLGHLEKKE